MEQDLGAKLGVLHLAVALAAIAFGAAVIFSRKGTRVHLWLGRAYVLSMVATNGTALMIYRLFGHFGPFHWMALFSLAVIAVGYWSARHRTPGWKVRHAYFMTGSYVGLMAALVSEIASRAEITSFFHAVLFSSLVVSALGIWLMLRLIPPILTGPR